MRTVYRSKLEVSNQQQQYVWIQIGGTIAPDAKCKYILYMCPVVLSTKIGLIHVEDDINQDPPIRNYGASI